MSAIERIKDFGRWLGEVDARLGAASPPPTALGLSDGAPVALQRSVTGYEVSRPVAAGDSGPVYLSKDSVLLADIKVSPEAATYGLSAARVEAAKASPFPLEDGAFALSPGPAAWTEAGADWRLVAAPRQRIDDMRAALSAAGARPGEAFALIDGAPVSLGPARRSRLAPAAALIALIAAIAAAASVSYGAASLESAAQERLTAARQTLAAAEAEAASAQARRDAAAGPLRQAQIVEAALERAPSVVARLADLTAATPDNAYLKRLSIRPGIISGEFVAPDAAALAAAIGASPAFTSARLKGPARAEAETQQRATLDIMPEKGE